MSRNENSDENHWLDALFENNSLNPTKYNEALAYVQKNFMEVMILIINILFF